MLALAPFTALAFLDPTTGYYVTDNASFVEAETVRRSSDLASFTMVIVLPQDNPVAFEGTVEIDCRSNMVRWTRAREIDRNNVAGPFSDWSDAAWRPTAGGMTQVRLLVCENDGDALPHRPISRADIVREAHAPKPKPTSLLGRIE